jgi:uncharacterized protein YndB with AHSA1/START domain
MKLMEVKVSRVVAAKPAAVFDVWVDPANPGSPWNAGVRRIVNFAVDGLYYWEVNHEGRKWAHYGRFVRIERPGLVEYTWMSEATKGLESVVTVRFEPLGEETEVTLVHSGVPDDDMGRGHEGGWTWFLGNLADRFAVHEEA